MDKNFVVGKKLLEVLVGSNRETLHVAKVSQDPRATYIGDPNENNFIVNVTVEGGARIVGFASEEDLVSDLLRVRKGDKLFFLSAKESDNTFTTTSGAEVTTRQYQGVTLLQIELGEGGVPLISTEARTPVKPQMPRGTGGASSGIAQRGTATQQPAGPSAFEQIEDSK